jgi:NADH-quinone oxidoreductase subunit N
LAGLVKSEKIGAEAALKYFLLGAFSTGFLLYGIALIYGATGQTNLTEIAAAAEPTLLFFAGSALLLVGIFFKIAAVPFHMWTPDVYQGTPTTLTAFMATAAKSATLWPLF